MSEHPPSNKPLKIAVASGKGGTGKTTFAVNLASTWQKTKHVLFMDCDVEAPDAHLFLKPVFDHTLVVKKNIPVIDPLKCTYCGKCAAACQFNAISILNNPLMPQPRALVFQDLCHDCGVCSLVCPEYAITEVSQRVGELHFDAGKNSLEFSEGQLDIGQPSAAPVIQSLKTENALKERDFDIIIYDAPPGTSCAVVETIRDADLILLVTEPTPFGIHDLNLMVQLVQNMNKPAAIIINRAGISNNQQTAQIENMGYPVIYQLPYQLQFASTIAGGELLITHFPEIARQFFDLATFILQDSLQEHKI